ncbi:hypothetical protein KFK09_019817 [Dendrobium nobile]|uniref:Transmembrane protein n=1 Tax=Dendrobium nobile TaxID=94219 RepID=A0A8T3ARI6_DENNO|nr:hypothetical protein KFK09_019817 [Dendrobium nobile]
MSASKMASVLLLVSFLVLLMASGGGLRPVEAARVFREDLQVITRRLEFVFESKLKGPQLESGTSGCHHGPGGGNGTCPP